MTNRPAPKHEADLLSDEQLACQAQAGCRASFEALVQRFQTPLLNYLHQFVRNHDDAEELLQDTFLKAYRNLHRYRDAWRFSTWVYTIAHRIAVSHHRKRVPTPAGDAMNRLPAQQQDVLEHLAQAEERENIWALARRELSDIQFTILWMHYVEDIPLKDIAVTMKRTAISIRTALFRARKKLLPHLEHLAAIDDEAADRQARAGESAAKHDATGAGKATLPRFVTPKPSAAYHSGGTAS